MVEIKECEVKTNELLKDIIPFAIYIKYIENGKEKIRTYFPDIIIDYEKRIEELNELLNRGMPGVERSIRAVKFSFHRGFISGLLFSVIVFFIFWNIFQ